MSSFLLKTIEDLKNTIRNIISTTRDGTQFQGSVKAESLILNMDAELYSKNGTIRQRNYSGLDVELATAADLTRFINSNGETPMVGNLNLGKKYIQNTTGVYLTTNQTPSKPPTAQCLLFFKDDALHSMTSASEMKKTYVTQEGLTANLNVANLNVGSLKFFQNDDATVKKSRVIHPFTLDTSTPTSLASVTTADANIVFKLYAKCDVAAVDDMLTLTFMCDGIVMFVDDLKFQLVSQNHLLRIKTNIMEKGKLIWNKVSINQAQKNNIYEYASTTTTEIHTFEILARWTTTTTSDANSVLSISQIYCDSF